MSTKCNWILNGLVDFPICEMCSQRFGRDINLQINTQYSKTCPKCSRKIASMKTHATVKKRIDEDPYYYDHIVEKRKSTSFKLHDDSNWNNIEKNRSTCTGRYGVDNVRKTQHCKDAIKQTKKDRYGDENYVNVEKSKQTCLNNNGVEWPMQSAEIRSKAALKYKYDGFVFDSKQELCFYIWLRDNKKQFEVNETLTITYVYAGKVHTYIPDFIVEGKIIEIKGDHFFK